MLPRKVIREALANAVMHRSYQDHSPIQIVRYSNRIEILNPGFSLKDMASLGTPGSRLRNPAIAAVLHEINWAETKGSGVRTMRRLADDAGLPLPEFSSDRQKNEFKVTLFLHHLLTEEDYAWLKSLTGDTVSADEARALIYARETGAVDNTACREFFRAGYAASQQSAAPLAGPWSAGETRCGKPNALHIACLGRTARFAPRTGQAQPGRWQAGARRWQADHPRW